MKCFTTYNAVSYRREAWPKNCWDIMNKPAFHTEGHGKYTYRKAEGGGGGNEWGEKRLTFFHASACLVYTTKPSTLISLDAGFCQDEVTNICSCTQTEALFTSAQQSVKSKHMWCSEAESLQGVLDAMKNRCSTFWPCNTPFSLWSKG